MGDKLDYPTEGCGRYLTDNEVKLYTDKDMSTLYKLNILSQEPNFRWCLNTGIYNSGQVYELDESGDQRIRCDECEFEMCFRHQTKWYSEYTYEQYNKAAESGDP